MPHSKRRHEGYLLVDSTASPGIPKELAATGHYVSISEGDKFEAPTITCSHCHTVVIINPSRTRDREWCAACDHYICDVCGAAKKAGAPCRTVHQLFDRIEKRILHG